MPITKEHIRCCINSRDRLNPLTETSSDFTFSFNDKVTRIVDIYVDSVQIPYSFYAINSNNNVLTFNNGVNSITITPGNYTATTLSTEIETRMAVVFAGQSPNVTFSNITFKLTISKSAPFIVDAYDDVPASTAATLLGFKESSASGTSVTGDSAINLAGPNYLLIKSSFLTKAIHHKTLYKDNSYQEVLFMAPVNVSPGDVISLEPELPIRLSHKIEIDTTDIIDVSIYDEFDNLLDLNGLDWAMQLILMTE